MTELDIVRPNLSQFAPTNWKELVLFADMMARSKAVPECYRNDPAAVIYAVQMGAEVGLGPGQSLQSIANIEGSLRMWGDTPLAIVQASGKLAWIQETSNFPESADEQEQEELYKTWWAKCVVQRVGEAAPNEQLYTYADAKRAGLWARKSSNGKAMPWTTSPKRLMKYRARGFLLRDIFPDVLKGIAIKEEFGDGYGEAPRNVTQSAQTPTGNEGLHEKMAGAMGAAGIVKQPPPPPVDESIPDFESMIVAQVVETLERGAFDRGIEIAVYKQIVVDTLGDRRLTKKSAPDVWKAVQAWEAPRAATEAEGADIGRPAEEQTCSECGGNGFDGGEPRSQEPCAMCGGSGKVVHEAD